MKSLYALSYSRYALPFRVPVKTSRGTFPVREGIRVSLSDEQGRCGSGEIAPWPGFNCESLDAAETALNRLGNALPATEPDAILPLAEFPCTRHAIAAALFLLNQPENLGATEPPNEKIARLLARTPDTLPEKLLEQIERELHNGFRVFKIKIGLGALADELRFCEKMLTVLAERHPDAKLRFDANGAWDNPRVLAEIAPLAAFPQLDFFEQPLNPSRENDQAVFSLPHATASKIALDESLREPWKMPDETPVIAVVKPLLIGDFERLRLWLAAPENKPRYVLSSVFESDCGRTILRHLCAENAFNPRALAFGIGTQSAFCA